MLLSIIFLGVLPLASAIKIGELNSTRRGVTKNPRTTSLTLLPITEKKFAAELYKVVASNGIPCVQLKVDALISIQYNTKLEEREEADLYVHHSPKTDGNCKEENWETMSISTKGFVLDWSFSKTSGGEFWYVDRISLTYNSSEPLLKSAMVRGRRVTLTTSADRLLFPAPVGKSHFCQGETITPLVNEDPNSDVDHTAKLFFREMQLQAFMYKKSGEFGPPYDCSLSSAKSSESAPVAAGAILAVATAGVLCGYAAFRYYKVKKVQYDTMA